MVTIAIIAGPSVRDQRAAVGRGEHQDDADDGEREADRGERPQARWDVDEERPDRQQRRQDPGGLVTVYLPL